MKNFVNWIRFCCVLKESKGKVIPVGTMMSFERIGGKALLILNVGIRWRWVANIMPFTIGKVIPVGTMMSFERIGGKALLILNVGISWRWVANIMPFTIGKEIRCPLNRRLGGHQRRSGRLGKNTNQFVTDKGKSNKMQQCIKILLFHMYMKLNIFRATHRPSSGA